MFETELFGMRDVLLIMTENVCAAITAGSRNLKGNLMWILTTHSGTFANSCPLFNNFNSDY